MNTTEALKILRKYNEWRRSDDNSLEMPHPKELGVAIDTVVAALTWQRD